MQTYNIGDRVTIQRKCTYRDAPTWSDSWSDLGMDPLIGKTGIITAISGTKYYIAFDGEAEAAYNFPVESFYIADKNKMIIYKIKQIETRWKTYQEKKYALSRL